jgi:hypothetical protein
MVIQPRRRIQKRKEWETRKKDGKNADKDANGSSTRWTHHAVGGEV